MSEQDESTLAEYIDVDRLFVPARGDLEINADTLETWGRQAYGALPWTELLQQPRAVVLAEAGSGKTAEFNAQLVRLRLERKDAFFAPIEQIAEVGFLETLGPALRADFEAWAASTRPGWLLLDSVDEAKLRKHSLSTALSRVAEALGPAAARAFIVISCRGSDWNGAVDLKLVSEYLPAPRPIRQEETDPDRLLLAPLDRETRREARGDDAPAASVTVFAMAALSRTQQRTFLKARGVDDPEPFERAVRLKGLSRLTERPGDLDMLVSSWRGGSGFGSRRAMTELQVRLRLRERKDRSDAGEMSETDARQAAERLAAAMTLGRVLSVRATYEQLPPGDALDPADVLPELKPSQHAALLRRGLFAPATFGRVRFHHRSAIEYLTACWFQRLRDSGRLSDTVVLSVFTRRRLGIETIPPSLRPAAAWLARDCTPLREFMLRHEPLALIQHGDPASLPLADRAKLLHRYAALHAEGQAPGQHVDEQALWMFSDERLAPAIADAWALNPHADFRFDLLRLIDIGAIPGCEDLVRQAALDADGEIYNRIVAARALSRLGDRSGQRRLAQAMLRSPADFGPRLAPDLAATLFPDVLGVPDLLRLIDETKPARAYEVEGFSYHLDGLYAACATRAARRAFLEGIADLCLQPPLVDYEGLSARHWELTRKLLDLARAAVLRSDEDGVTPGLLRLLLAAQQAQHDSSRGDAPNLQDLVAARPKLNQALFWANLKAASERDPDDARDPTIWMLRGSPHQFWRVTASDLPWLEAAMRSRPDMAERRLALSAAYVLLRDGDGAAAALDGLAARVARDPVLADDLARYRTPRPVSESALAWRRRNAVIEEKAAKDKAAIERDWLALRERLRADPTILSDPARLARWPGPWELLLLTRWLSWASGVRLQQAGAEAERLRAAFGDDVAAAYRSGLKTLWRRTRPERPVFGPNGRRTVKHTTELAMAGLNLEATEPEALAKLTAPEALRAARWVCLGDQDVPAWLEQLLVAWPEVAGKLVMTEIRREWAFAPERHGSFLYRAEDSLSLTGPLRRGLLNLTTRTPPPHPSRVYASQRILGRLDLSEPERAKVLGLVRRRLAERTAAPEWDWRLAYISAIFDLDPALGVDTLSQILSQEPPRHRRVRGEEAFSGLFGMARGTAVRGLARADVPTLAVLLRLAYAVVDPKHDHRRDGGFTPDRRDEAESARNRVLSALIQRGGEEAYHALRSMVADRAVGSRTHRFLEIAREVAQDASEGEPWSGDDVARFEVSALSPIVSGEGLLQLGVEVIADLNGRYGFGDFSSRPLLETAKDEFAVQNFLAEHFDLRARGRYIVSREKQIVADLKPDLVLTSTQPAAEVAIEVKHGGKGWSLKTLRDALHVQLASNYLCVPIRRHGILVITNHRGQRFWRDEAEAELLSFEDVIGELDAEARALTRNDVHAVGVRVCGLNAAHPSVRRGSARSSRRAEI